MLLFSYPAAAMVVHQCPAEETVSGMDRVDLQNQADDILQNIQWHAQDAYYNADQLQSFTRNTQISWQTDASNLTQIKYDVNKMSNELCRLDTIRHDLAPWQKAEIRRISPTLQLAADNTQDAILFLNNHQDDLWLGTYVKYANNLDNLTRNLVNTVNQAVSYAKVSPEYHNLRHEITSPAVGD